MDLPSNNSVCTLQDKVLKMIMSRKMPKISLVKTLWSILGYRISFFSSLYRTEEIKNIKQVVVPKIQSRQLFDKSFKVESLDSSKRCTLLSDREEN